VRWGWPPPWSIQNGVVSNRHKHPRQASVVLRPPAGDGAEPVARSVEWPSPIRDSAWVDADGTPVACTRWAGAEQAGRAAPAFGAGARTAVLRPQRAHGGDPAGPRGAVAADRSVPTTAGCPGQGRHTDFVVAEFKDDRAARRSTCPDNTPPTTDHKKPRVGRSCKGCVVSGRQCAQRHRDPAAKLDPVRRANLPDRGIHDLLDDAQSASDTVHAGQAERRGADPHPAGHRPHRRVSPAPRPTTGRGPASAVGPPIRIPSAPAPWVVGRRPTKAPTQQRHQTRAGAPPGQPAARTRADTCRSSVTCPRDDSLLHPRGCDLRRHQRWSGVVVAGWPPARSPSRLGHAGCDAPALMAALMAGRPGGDSHPRGGWADDDLRLGQRDREPSRDIGAGCRCSGARTCLMSGSCRSNEFVALTTVSVTGRWSVAAGFRWPRHL